eukprot:gb/GECG01006404.1/.p1 GENE.gb/GECG01006404.1/~~gb/GECG01006404.1/.p1  ORF type:complete len:102 (+),score=3.39 gb/GECG01006404.1/:1-306(+)
MPQCRDLSGNSLQSVPASTFSQLGSLKELYVFNSYSSSCSYAALELVLAGRNLDNNFLNHFRPEIVSMGNNPNIQVMYVYKVKHVVTSRIDALVSVLQNSA